MHYSLCITFTKLLELGKGLSDMCQSFLTTNQPCNKQSILALEKKSV